MDTTSKLLSDNCQTEYEVIVVGAGVAGSSTAYHLASTLENGSKILLLEQVSYNLNGFITPYFAQERGRKSH